MRKLSVSAALKRLENRVVSSSINSDTLTPVDQRDITIVCAALRMVEGCAEHIDDADMCPIYRMKLPCSWQTAAKGLLGCLTECHSPMRITA